MKNKITVGIYAWANKKWFVSANNGSRRICLVNNMWYFHDFDAACYNSERDAIRSLKKKCKCRQIKDLNTADGNNIVRHYEINKVPLCNINSKE